MRLLMMVAQAIAHRSKSKSATLPHIRKAVAMLELTDDDAARNVLAALGMTRPERSSPPEFIVELVRESVGNQFLPWSEGASKVLQAIKGGPIFYRAPVLLTPSSLKGGRTEPGGGDRVSRKTADPVVCDTDEPSQSDPRAGLSLPGHSNVETDACRESGQPGQNRSVPEVLDGVNRLPDTQIDVQALSAAQVAVIPPFLAFAKSGTKQPMPVSALG